MSKKMSELLPANRAKDPLEVLQNRLFDRKAPANAALLPERKIPSLALDLGAIIDDMLMTDTIGGDPESTGQALPGMAMPFVKRTTTPTSLKNIYTTMSKDVKSQLDNIFKAVEKNDFVNYSALSGVSSFAHRFAKFLRDIVPKRIKSDKTKVFGTSRRKIELETYERLDEEIEYLNEILDKRLSSWKKPPLSSERIDEIFSTMPGWDTDEKVLLINRLLKENDTKKLKSMGIGLSDFEVKALQEHIKKYPDQSVLKSRHNLSTEETKAFKDLQLSIDKIDRTVKDMGLIKNIRSESLERPKVVPFGDELKRTAEDRMINQAFEQKKERAKRGSNKVIDLKDAINRRTKKDE